MRISYVGNYTRSILNAAQLHSMTYLKPKVRELNFVVHVLKKDEISREIAPSYLSLI